jgi:hypothetical protein
MCHPIMRSLYAIQANTDKNQDEFKEEWTYAQGQFHASKSVGGNDCKIPNIQRLSLETKRRASCPATLFTRKAFPVTII